MNATIGETIEALRGALKDYIEATYHVSHPQLVAARSALLDRLGVIAQRPYLESTPRYRSGRPLASLGLPAAAATLLTRLADDAGGERLVWDPPYAHQCDALESTLVRGRSIVVTTGTGSGKTECFLLPALGRLAEEAARPRSAFGAAPGVRVMVLYPMNALVNDQLGRLRRLLGDERVRAQFKEWAGRPATFARYTSRTPFPGVRHGDARDGNRMKGFGDFYVETERAANDPTSPLHERSRRLRAALHARGKWPAKPDLDAWFGRKGTSWKGRCLTQPGDAELITRHEVQAAAPDVLVTNYSMLEYMLMRPIERPIFEQTAAWLRANPDERFWLVLDEAHMYRGAAGSEVALLVRRLRSRLGIPAARMQVICTSASFHDQAYAREFAADLTGKDAAEFDVPPGDLDDRPAAAPGNADDAAALAAIDLATFYEAGEEGRREALAPLLRYRGVAAPAEVGAALYAALKDYPPMSLLVNKAMRSAMPVDELGAQLFPDCDATTGAAAATVLATLGSVARRSPAEPGLLPCRVHAFFRGLPGLWACMDPACPEVDGDPGPRPAGRLYSQPRDVCACGARVLEFFTCRHCGVAFARAYTDDLHRPTYLWSTAGGRVDGPGMRALEPLDLLLEEPEARAVAGEVDLADYDLDTGRLDPLESPRLRTVGVPLQDRRSRPPEPGGTAARPGQFRPCPCCQQGMSFGRSSVQDHQTKGDQPFLALVERQIKLQPPSTGHDAPPRTFAPLQGRKVLVFSDSRQTAARLAPSLQDYSTRDVLRALLVRGFARVQRAHPRPERLNLEHLYPATLLGAAELRVRLRPVLRQSETFSEEQEAWDLVAGGALDAPAELVLALEDLGQTTPPIGLLKQLLGCLTDRFTGLAALAIGSVSETAKFDLDALANLPGIATTREQKRAVLGAWLHEWVTGPGVFLSRLPLALADGVKSHSGRFAQLTRVLPGPAKKVFLEGWLPALQRHFCESVAPGKYRLLGRHLTLDLRAGWAICDRCQQPQRPVPGYGDCTRCGAAGLRALDPAADPVFRARRGYYRAPAAAALAEPPQVPMALITAEHTAQLNAAGGSDVFSRAEQYELLFQDVQLGPGPDGREEPAVDVMCCTTTMEVGIDIGSLSGVALRNIPPSRANYQQRAGRAGRRASAVSTVLAFGSADSHDEHYFSAPDEMIRGEVVDPRLNLDNYDITRRHVTAYLLQGYHRDRVPEYAPGASPQLFSTLGSVDEFLAGGGALGQADFAQWLRHHEDDLRSDLQEWLPPQLAAADRDRLLDGIVTETCTLLDEALADAAHDEPAPAGVPAAPSPTALPDAPAPEAPPEPGDERPAGTPTQLLDYLLYKGVLPRYAFPTDVATFHIFDPELSTPYRPSFKYTPSQGLSIALTQYAPGKEVWVDKKLWRSAALYSPFRGERGRAWAQKRIYHACPTCGFAVTDQSGAPGTVVPCRACGADMSPGRRWLRPPGFAHPLDLPEGTGSPDDAPPPAIATRAKLHAGVQEGRWERVTDQVQISAMREHLLVTNAGPEDEGYDYCTYCGRIGPHAGPSSEVGAGHKRPDPAFNDACDGDRTARGIVLGSDFISDVLLIRLGVIAPVRLTPGEFSTRSALRTLCEAVVISATRALGLEPGELDAEFRPALSPGGPLGQEGELYLYDTLPGGAGFAQQVGARARAVLEDALRLLEGCPAGAECDRSCYRCLRSFKNKYEHDLLDRFLAADLLRHVLTGAPIALDAGRRAAATRLLYEDLVRQDLPGVTLVRDAPLSAPGLPSIEVPLLATRASGDQVAVCVSHPLLPQEFEGADLQAWADNQAATTFLPPLSELHVRRHLPHATGAVLKGLGLDAV